MTDLPADALQLARWTVDVRQQRRAAAAPSSSPPATTSGGHRPRATARSTRCTGRSTRRSRASSTGHPRLLAYDIHALGEGTDTIGAVSVRIAPPDIGGERGAGEYAGEASGPNIIAASIEAYIAALNMLLAEAHWSGATEAAGNRKGVAVSAGTAREQRADLDEAEVPNDTTAWFER